LFWEDNLVAAGTLRRDSGGAANTTRNGAATNETRSNRLSRTKGKQAVASNNGSNNEVTSGYLFGGSFIADTEDGEEKDDGDPSHLRFSSQKSFRYAIIVGW
jgi:hypothetical protein